MTTGFAALQNAKNELIRKGLKGGVFVAPYTSPAIVASNLFDATTGALKNPLPSGYKGIGYLTDAGAKFANAIKQTDITAWSTNDPVRTDVTSDITTLVIEPQETNQQTLALYWGVALSSIVPGTNGVIEIDRPDVMIPQYMRVLVLAVDETNYGELVLARFLPYALVTARADQTFANGASAITYGVTIQAYNDSVLGYPEASFVGGEAAMALQAASGFNRTVTCSTASSLILTATAGSFYPTDVGAIVAGTGITPGTTIASYTDATHVTLSAVTTATASGVAVTIDGE